MAHPKKGLSAGQGATGTAPKTTGVVPTNTPPPVPTADSDTDMTKNVSREALADYADMVRRRDAHLAELKHHPRQTVSEDHLDAATWEEWIDGNLSDEYMEEKLRNHPDCKSCRSNYEHYKALKNKRSLAERKSTTRL